MNIILQTYELLSQNFIPLFSEKFKKKPCPESNPFVRLHNSTQSSVKRMMCSSKRHFLRSICCFLCQNVLPFLERMRKRERKTSELIFHCSQNRITQDEGKTVSALDRPSSHYCYLICNKIEKNRCIDICNRVQ